MAEPQPPPGRGGPESPPSPPQGGDAPPEGEKLITPSHFQRIADRITVSSEFVIHGVVNVNTASAEVLACLPGLDLTIGEAIVSYRQRSGDFTSLGQLLDVPGIDADVFKKACSRLTVRPGTFRILAEGLIPSTGARKRLEAVVRMTRYRFETLNLREEM
jgi:competence ComEA-like helix-hairpin-helix protein